MTDRIEKVLGIAVEEGLPRALGYYSLLIAPAPKPRTRTSGYNKYTPQGQMTAVNTNYNKELNDILLQHPNFQLKMLHNQHL